MIAENIETSVDFLPNVEVSSRLSDINYVHLVFIFSQSSQAAELCKSDLTAYPPQVLYNDLFQYIAINAFNYKLLLNRCVL